ncbi:hypothetical protein N0V83_004201 [Neocucurbitaria cava]|uniref:Uncharacterized protein n=1 Tax=Neocucurbitaria cava TaxID=798079 RepID=A0A9W9CN36_9PLEO|nr:hypothetical protein N0V83_004201 [Neocucurbitaria cava]
MSGFTTTTIRANAPNTFFVTPYTGEVAPEPQIRPAKCPVYEPLHRRKHSGTKYDVRSTYSKDHTLRSPYRVTELQPSDTTPSPFNLSALSQNLYALYIFLTVDDTHIALERAEREWNDRELTLLQACAFKELWFERTMQRPLRRAKRWAVRKVRFAPKWVFLRALDGVVAVQMSVVDGAVELGKCIESNEEIVEIVEKGLEVLGQCESMAGQYADGY